MTKPALVIVGASGAGRRVADIALDAQDAGTVSFASIGVLDDSPSATNLERLQRQGLEYLGNVNDWLSSAPPARFVVGLGDTQARQRISATFMAHNHVPATLIAPTARVSRTAVIGIGTVVSPGVEISTNATLGRFVHVMANAVVSHDTAIGEACNINPGAILAGSVSAGDCVTVGAGAVVLQGLTVGDRVLVGAGSVVTRDIPADSVVKGVPAR